MTISCVQRPVNGTSNTKTPILFTINNVELKKQIKEYERMNSTVGYEGFIYMNIEFNPEKDITIYNIQYKGDTSFLENGSSSFAMKCDNLIVIGSYYSFSVVGTSAGYIWSILKEICPEKYSRYLEGAVSIPNTGYTEILQLTFSKDKLVDKKTILK